MPKDVSYELSKRDKWYRRVRADGGYIAYKKNYGMLVLHEPSGTVYRVLQSDVDSVLAGEDISHRYDIPDRPLKTLCKKLFTDSVDSKRK